MDARRSGSKASVRRAIVVTALVVLLLVAPHGVHARSSGAKDHICLDLVDSELSVRVDDEDVERRPDGSAEVAALNLTVVYRTAAPPVGVEGTELSASIGDVPRNVSVSISPATTYLIAVPTQQEYEAAFQVVAGARGEAVDLEDHEVEVRFEASCNGTVRASGVTFVYRAPDEGSQTAEADAEGADPGSGAGLAAAGDDGGRAPAVVGMVGGAVLVAAAAVVALRRR